MVCLFMAHRKLVYHIRVGNFLFLCNSKYDLPPVYSETNKQPDQISSVCSVAAKFVESTCLYCFVYR